jgi:hypothetical protein
VKCEAYFTGTRETRKVNELNNVPEAFWFPKEGRIGDCVMLETPGFGNFRGNYTRRPSKCESLWKKMIGKPYSGKLNVRFTLWSNKLL